MSVRFTSEQIRLQTEFAAKLYQDKVDTNDIAKQLGLSRRTVWNRLYAAGIITREVSEEDVCPKGHANPERYSGGNCIPCAREYALEYVKANPPTREQVVRSNVLKTTYNRALKMEMIREYGGLCACCGQDEWEFLTIGHIRNNGFEEKKINGSGVQLYRSLKQRGWPKDDYRLECWNCNSAKGAFGYCPHEKGHRR